MIALIFIIVLIGTLAGIWGYKYWQTTTVISDDKIFKQADVTVDYGQKTIQIGKHLYHVTKVNKVQSKWMGDNKRYLEVTVDDIKKPIHRVGIIGPEALIDDFAERLKIALRKAGHSTI